MKLTVDNADTPEMKARSKQVIFIIFDCKVKLTSVNDDYKDNVGDGPGGNDGVRNTTAEPHTTTR